MEDWQALLLFFDLAAVEVMSGLFRDPQCLADPGPRRAGLTRGFDDLPAPAREQFDGLRVRAAPPELRLPLPLQGTVLRPARA